MRTALNALSEELRRLKSSGVTALNVSPESIAALRKVIQARSAKVPQIGDTPVVAKSGVSDNAPAKQVRPVGGVESSRSFAPTTAFSAKAESALPPPAKVVIPPGDKASQWAWLRDHVINHPVCIANVRTGKKVVMGVGSLEAKIMFVGEAPGAEEEVQGEPFVGPAGQLLSKMIGAMGLNRELVYIANIMNWRPQLPTPDGVQQIGNRAPTTEEMAVCLPFLHAQIEIVNPDIIVALGSTAAQGLLGVGAFKTLGEVRGQWKTYLGKPLIVTYHPSYLLRQESSGANAARKAKRAAWEDLLKVMERAGLTISDKQRAFFSEK